MKCITLEEGNWDVDLGEQGNEIEHERIFLLILPSSNWYECLIFKFDFSSVWGKIVIIKHCVNVS